MIDTARYAVHELAKLDLDARLDLVASGAAAIAAEAQAIGAGDAGVHLAGEGHPLQLAHQGGEGHEGMANQLLIFASPPRCIGLRLDQTDRQC